MTRKTKKPHESNDALNDLTEAVNNLDPLAISDQESSPKHEEAGNVVRFVWDNPPNKTIANGWPLEQGAEQLASWPVPNPPTASLRPRGGGISRTQTSVSNWIVVVCVFGLDEDRIAKVVEQIQLWHASNPSSVPLFLTDCAQPQAFRRAGYIFEYFPADIYGGEHQREQFVAQFEMLWKKWNGAVLIDFSAESFLRDRLENYEQYLRPATGADKVFDPRRLVKPSALPPVTDYAALRAEYLSKTNLHQADTFALYRILGNDLPEVHEAGRTLNNLRFILDHEPSFENCEKRWVVNRIADPEMERDILNLLKERHQSFIHLPFDLRIYHKSEWDLDGFPEPNFLLNGRFENMMPEDQLRAMVHIRRKKAVYAFNKNGACNVALEEGRELAKWVLPWDGDCFLTTEAWQEITSSILENPHLKYFCVPTAKVAGTEPLLQSADISSDAVGAPQVIFRSDTTETFDDTLACSERPKVNLFWRLGVQGDWDQWSDDVWGPPRPTYSEDAGAFGMAGWVARLTSNQHDLQSCTAAQIEESNEALVEFLDTLDDKALALSFDPERLTVYDVQTIQNISQAPADTNMGRLHARLVQEAELAVQRGSYSVIDKPAPAPSGDPQDYFRPSRFWWPTPATLDGMPGAWREGKPRPDSLPFSSTIDNYDTTKLQRFLTDTTVLALAGHATSNPLFNTHAVQLVRTWFVNKNTRMNPHLRFSDINPRKDEGSEAGIADMAGVVHLVDAIRLLKRSGALAEPDFKSVQEWLREYLDWLLVSPQGERAKTSSRQIGTCYDLQVAAISAFLGDVEQLQATLLRARTRLPAQFSQTGHQKQEVRRRDARHFCFLNIQNWVYLANLAETLGDPLWAFTFESDRNLEKCLRWVLSHTRSDSSNIQQHSRFDWDRVLPIISVGLAKFGGSDGLALAMQSVRKPIFNPIAEVVPFWMLANGLQDAGWSASEKTVSILNHRSRYVAGSRNQAAQVNLSVDDLEMRLWGGYADQATASLRQIILSPQKQGEDVEKAAWVLARWQFHRGEREDALQTLQAIPPSRRASQKAHVLLEADLLRLNGRVEESRCLVEESLSQRPEDPSLLFLMANCFGNSLREGEAGDAGQLEWINKVYFGHGLTSIEKIDPDLPVSFFNIQGAAPVFHQSLGPHDPKVSVIIPVFNGAETIPVALRSLCDQTWSNLEIIVSDDASTDDTCRIVREFAKDDARIRLVANKTNAGAYMARNAGLAQATGDFITVHDADDWSHPQKIELQVRQLLSRNSEGAVLTTWGRVDPQLNMLSNWRPVATMFSTNHSSLLFPRAVVDEIGSWDNVRIGADMEFLWRFRKRFGENAVSTVNSKVPLSLSLEREEALTKSEATHVRTVYHGIRRDYRRAYLRWQDSRPPEELKLENDDLDNRAFPAPKLMQPQRSTSHRFDEIFVADLSQKGFAIERTISLITHSAELGKSVGVFHWADYQGDVDADLHHDINRLLDEFRIEQICAFQKAKAGRVYFCDANLSHYVVAGIPEFDTQEISVLCVDAGAPEVIYDRRRRRMPTLDELEAIFKLKCKWEPSPDVGS